NAPPPGWAVLPYFLRKAWIRATLAATRGINRRCPCILQHEQTGTSMQTFYPGIKPYQRHQIAVEPPHELYVDESGNPEGIPVLFVHGGPGAGCGKYDRRFFDPEIYRIVLFDQRGAGRSRPHAELQGNSTQKLVADIEVIRTSLGIDKWVLFGGSWGSTLSLVYAQTYPER